MEESTTETPQLEFVTRRSSGEVWWVWLKWTLLRPARLISDAVIIFGGLYFALWGEGFFRSLGIFALGFVVLALLVYSFVIWRLIAKEPAVTAPATVSIFLWGIRISSHLRSVSLTWENFGSFVETRDLIILRLRLASQLIVLPKRDLQDGQLSTLIAILSQQLRG